jgi:hypothetical protein
VCGGLLLQEMFSEQLPQAASSFHRRILLLLKGWIYVQNWQMWERLRCSLACEQKNQ